MKYTYLGGRNDLGQIVHARNSIPVKFALSDEVEIPENFRLVVWQSNDSPLASIDGPKTIKVKDIPGLKKGFLQFSVNLTMFFFNDEPGSPMFKLDHDEIACQKRDEDGNTKAERYKYLFSISGLIDVDDIDEEFYYEHYKTDMVDEADNGVFKQFDKMGRTAILYTEMFFRYEFLNLPGAGDLVLSLLEDNLFEYGKKRNGAILTVAQDEVERELKDFIKKVYSEDLGLEVTPYFAHVSEYKH